MQPHRLMMESPRKKELNTRRKIIKLNIKTEKRFSPHQERKWRGFGALRKQSWERGPSKWHWHSTLCSLNGRRWKLAVIGGVFPTSSQSHQKVLGTFCIYFIRISSPRSKWSYTAKAEKNMENWAWAENSAAEHAWDSPGDPTNLGRYFWREFVRSHLR